MAVGQEKMGFISLLTIAPVSFKIRPDCGMSRAVTQKRPPKPLNATSLDALAIHYVGRFATSRAKLISYLQRKLRERGWDGEAPADISALADKCVGYGYIDDAAYAGMKARGLTQRGYGARRVDEALRAAGIAEEQREVVRDGLDLAARKAAVLRFAARRRVGPYARDAAATMDIKEEQRQVAAFLRAGHDMALARQVLALAPGRDLDAWLEEE